MVNFLDMPFNYGLKYAFDCNTYLSGDVWENFTGGTNATLKGTSKAVDGSLFMPKTTGYGYWMVNDNYEDSTKYIICKATNTPSDDYFYDIFSERGASMLYTTDIHVHGSKSCFAMYANGKAVDTGILPNNYHIIAAVKSGTVATIYVDGVQYGELTNCTKFIPTNYGLNTGESTGKTPTSGWQDVYIRCALVCGFAHSPHEILQNSKWLLAEYGLASKPIDGIMSGADAAAIAWCLAHNIEQEINLEEKTEIYREGIIGGDEEPYNTNSYLNVSVNYDGTIATEPAATDMTRGFILNYGDVNTGETQSTIRIWTKIETVESENYKVVNYIMATVTKPDGTEETKEMNFVYRDYLNVEMSLIKMETFENGIQFYYSKSDNNPPIQSTFVTFPTASGDYLGATNQ